MATERDSLTKNADGVRLPQSGDHEGAIKAFTEAIDLDPVHASIYRNRAESYLAADKTAEADADIAKADQLVQASVELAIEAHSKTFLQKLWGFIAR